MSARTIQARLAAETRYRPHEDHSDLRREFKTETLAEFIRRTVDTAPELTLDQRERLALLLRPTAEAGAA